MGRTYSTGKFDTQKSERGIFSCGDWEASHSAPEMPGSKWWICRKIVWNVTLI